MTVTASARGIIAEAERLALDADLSVRCHVNSVSQMTPFGVLVFECVFAQLMQPGQATADLLTEAQVWFRGRVPG